MKARIKSLEPGAVHRPTIRTAKALHPQAEGQTLKVAKHISMPPQSHPLTARTAMRLRPGIFFAFFNQPLYIYRIMEYQ